MITERDKSGEAGGRDSESDPVESAGETTAAATGSAEVGAATGHTQGAPAAPPVGADTMVEVSDGPGSEDEG